MVVERNWKVWEWKMVGRWRRRRIMLLINGIVVAVVFVIVGSLVEDGKSENPR